MNNKCYSLLSSHWMSALWKCMLGKIKQFPLAAYGFIILLLGVLQYFLGVILAFSCNVLYLPYQLHGVSVWLVWYSWIPIVISLFLILSDVLVLLHMKRDKGVVSCNPLKEKSLTVVLTAYNDEESIGLAVNDFKAHPLTKRVIVVDNNSTDNTGKEASRAGARVVKEMQQGYGHCVYRALKEGLRHTDTELTLLCEGDMTFRAYDIDKFLAYIYHCDLVNGTRIVEQLRCFDSQLTSFMYFGNFAVGKLLEMKHLGMGTFTDVGTTYKLCRNSCLFELMPYLNPNINLEFNAHFLDVALSRGVKIVECPVTFHRRVGVSKGGNKNNLRALKVGLLMIIGILLSWKLRRK